ncbi:MAG: hypothetical protein JOY54_20865 [Acidobacteriaceae bacterium]|nr:hypothetical protein [Acidobacteriaceae bacterium]
MRALVYGLFFALSLKAADVPVSTPADIKNDTQLRAMSDELLRSKTLQLNNLDKPYFIQYIVSDSEEVSVNASLGGIIASNHLHVRQPRALVRVGNYKFDNTNSIFTVAPNFGLLPLDDDYSAMRTQFWLATDSLYKAATDQIARKRNALREVANPEIIPDLAPATPVRILEPVKKARFEQKSWEQLARKLSARFAAYPAVLDSNVRLRAIVSTYRVVNTEGTVLRIPEDLADIEIRASAVAPDGQRIWNHHLIALPNASAFPTEEQLNRAVDAVAHETEALTKAPLAEDYTGPVLFEQEAASQMMAQVLTDALRLQRKPLAPPEAANQVQVLEGVWSSRVGSKVAPDWLTIVDDPRKHAYLGQELAGQYDVDDEGVPAERLTLVDKGTLKGFLLSREPVRNYNASNGHGRLPGTFGAEQAVIGNLFVQADQPLTDAQLKAKLLDNAKEAGLKYGIIIRRLDFPSTASLEELQNLAREAKKNGYSRTLTPPLLAYRVYPDGHEELVRGLRFKEFSAKDLRDVEAASDQSYVLNYESNGTAFNIADAGSDITLSSVICPSLLFDSIDLSRVDTEGTKAPTVPPPALTAAALTK